MLRGVSHPDLTPRRSACKPEPQADVERRSSHRLGYALAGLGVAGLAAAIATRPSDARSAAAQDWSPFVLVAGLLLIGLIADDDGLFATAGHQLARAARSGPALFVGATVMVGVVTAVLNLDTSVAFLTPVLVYTARSRGAGEAPLLYGCLLLSNAGSLFLPGSNLTNLIVLGHLRLSGAQFLDHMWAPALIALMVTAGVLALFEHRALSVTAEDLTRPEKPVLGLGLIAVVAATVIVVVLHAPALPAAVVGVVAIGIRLVTGKDQPRHVAEVLGVPVLLGLFGVAVALGTLGRVWSGPATLLAHLDLWGTAAVAAFSSVLVNNLPAASLLAARTPPPSLCAVDRSQPRAESLRNRIPRMAFVAAGGAHRRSATLDCQGHPPRCCVGSTLDGRGARSAGPDRIPVGPKTAGAYARIRFTVG
jgi:arsenical pump membrane protein